MLGCILRIYSALESWKPGEFTQKMIGYFSLLPQSTFTSWGLSSFLISPRRKLSFPEGFALLWMPGKSLIRVAAIPERRFWTYDGQKRFSIWYTFPDSLQKRNVNWLFVLPRIHFPPLPSSLAMEVNMTEVILDFLNVAIHQILFNRDIYPEDVFSQTKHYGIPVRMSRHPDLNQYIVDSLIASKDWLNSVIIFCTGQQTSSSSHPLIALGPCRVKQKKS